MFPAKEPNALIKILGSYVITQNTLFFNKIGGGVPTSDEINEVKSTAWQEARMCTMGPGWKITISKLTISEMVIFRPGPIVVPSLTIDGDLLWSFEYDREDCTCC